MFDMSWGEVLVIGTVALVAIGPKDLPKALRMAGQAVGKVRRMAGEFQAQFNEAMREADLEELRKNASDINDAVAPFKSQFDPLKSANEQLKKVIGLPELPELPSIEAAAPASASEAAAATAVPAKATKTAKTASKAAVQTTAAVPGRGAAKPAARKKPAEPKVVTVKAAEKASSAKAKSAPAAKRVAAKKPGKKPSAGEKA